MSFDLSHEGDEVVKAVDVMREGNDSAPGPAQVRNSFNISQQLSQNWVCQLEVNQGDGSEGCEKEIILARTLALHQNNNEGFS